MKVNCIQTKLIDSNKVYWIKWKPSAFKQIYLNQMKVKCLQINLTDLNESQVHSNKANWFKWKESAFKQR